MAVRPLFVRKPRRSATNAAIAIVVGYFAHRLVPRTPLATVLAEMVVAFVGLAALTLFILAHHRKAGQARIINQTQEEVILIGIFGLFWVAFLLGLRAWNDRHGFGSLAATAADPAETLQDITPPLHRQSARIGECVGGHMMCVVQDSRRYW
ncbi:SubName: Full=Uncharacterized protein {ECO:0000313/EMBL:CCA74909.1} [Serendipita indica DSM 11827]|uniref:Uncharacterized protein n=1 Tax=Serendipita indica (strain DSM 11827) TaxID=1109443 RepID=G4TUB6_SERID|nr:SubName: Full=Uncharacterized protein {ECO:0000313/EMBL:CCA74909.1} [Serendipita indica DSM 11827]CCA74909.1 hypothetical protein PIIN_08879 [Serendipita indica DSM 11827]